ncbi:MAG: phosphoglycerate kinase [Verrucomicrobiota bacterium]|jgi:phosphoglycerate kinase|nr:phosphoglycerate kinase [Verrucomicrobiota bacterium]MDP7049276.1 phosphoglycerate kinase [Verrucomicrobiota bacterium]
MTKRTINDIDLRGKRVLARVDYNVPMARQDGAMVINDDTRIRATLPTLRTMTESGAKVVLAAHLGRPKGERVQSMSLRPVAERLSELIDQPVAFCEQCVGQTAAKATTKLEDSGLLLLENLRYHAEEEANDPGFATELAGDAEVYVNDAFGAAHRAHASTAGVADVLNDRGGQSVAGLLMERELQFLGDELESPKRPFVVILGGAKVSDKIKVIDRLLEKANTILIGGAMAYTFKLAKGLTVGKSLVERDKVDVALAALDKAAKRGVQFLIPTDNVVAMPTEIDGKFAFGDHRVNDDENIPDEVEGVDIGPKSVAAFSEAIAGARTILWNGPMGIFEDERFAGGTFAVAKAVCEVTTNGAKSIIGGGDSVKALNKAGLGDQVTFMSTGGGASLEFLEGKELPGVAALADK